MSAGAEVQDLLYDLDSALLTSGLVLWSQDIEHYAASLTATGGGGERGRGDEGVEKVRRE